MLEDEPRPLRQLDGQIPRDLETVCLRALAKSPARRYRKASELADDLRRHLRGEPVRARPIGYSERLGRWCLRYPVAAGLYLAVLFGSIAGFLYLSSLSTYLVHSTALEDAKSVAEMLQEVNASYSEVVGRVNQGEKRVEVTHEYLTLLGTLPLPVTFTKDAAERISRNTGMQVRLYSNYPFREQVTPLDQWQRETILLLEEKRRAGAQDLTLHNFTQIEGRPVLRFAAGQIMKQSCVKCHYTHKQSPKRDWKEGDLVGVLGITHPLNRDIALTRNGLSSAFFLTDMQRMICEQEPPRMSQRLSSLGDDSSTVAQRRTMDPKRLSRLLRGDLDVIVMTALAKEPSRRYPSPSSLAADLERYLNQEPIEARPASTMYRTRKWVTRIKGMFAASVLVSVALMGGFISTGLGLLEARRQTRLAQANLVTAEENYGSSGLSVLWHGKWRFIGANCVRKIGCVDPLPSSPSHRPFALSLRVDARAETARGGPGQLKT